MQGLLSLTSLCVCSFLILMTHVSVSLGMSTTRPCMLLLLCSDRCSVCTFDRPTIEELFCAASVLLFTPSHPLENRGYKACAVHSVSVCCLLATVCLFQAIVAFGEFIAFLAFLALLAFVTFVRLALLDDLYSFYSLLFCSCVGCFLAAAESSQRQFY